MRCEREINEIMNKTESIRRNTLIILDMLEKRELKLRGGFSPRPFMLAIDGRCGAGKSTLATALKNALERRIPKPAVTILHADDFFPRLEQRTAERLKTPGGNFDHERFSEVVLRKLLINKPFSFRPFDCKSMSLAEPISVESSHVAIIEGSYCLHPELRDHYDLKVFLDIDPEEQRERILMREGEEKFNAFIERWIPMEELYFNGCGVRECADAVIK